MGILEQINKAVNMNQVPELIKSNPKYAKIFLGLGQIDIFVKGVVEDTVANITDVSSYYIKTEIDGVYYSLQLFNKERNATVGYKWTIDSLLLECQTKVITNDIETITKRMIQRFGNKDISTDAINWLL